MWIIFVVLCSFLLPSFLAQNCDFDQKVGTNRTPIKLQHIPYNHYHGGDVCTWMIRSDIGYIVKLNCDLIISGGLMPVCPMDYFIVSRTGARDFVDGTKYCGTKSFLKHSVANRVTFKLYSMQNSTGGYMDCMAKAVPDPCNCGRRNSVARIAGGVETGVNEFPMVAALVMAGEIQPYCGAVLISEFRALTVRNCVTKRPLDSFHLIVGEHNTATSTDTALTKKHAIASYTCVNGCDTDTLVWDDIAMIKTRDQILLNRLVGVACLPWKHYKDDPDEYLGQKVEIAGWGDTSIMREKTSVLQKVTLDVISSSLCSDFYWNLTTYNMCTFTPGKDSCMGDSGGSVFWTAPDNGLLYSVAIVDLDVGCGKGWPGVNTRIAPNLQWILENSPESSYCVV